MNDHDISDNFRYPQPLNDRKVTQYTFTQNCGVEVMVAEEQMGGAEPSSINKVGTPSKISKFAATHNNTDVIPES